MDHLEREKGLTKPEKPNDYNGHVSHVLGDKPVETPRVTTKSVPRKRLNLGLSIAPPNAALRILHPCPALAELSQIARKLPGFVAVETALSASSGFNCTSECCVARECGV